MFEKEIEELNKAIKHLETDILPSQCNGNISCYNEHVQLYKWLKELKSYKESVETQNEPIIRLQEELETLKKNNAEIADQWCKEQQKVYDLVQEILCKANEWHYVKDGDLPNTEFGRVDVTVAYINAYDNPCKMDCCFDGTNFIYWDARKPIGWKKADIFGKIYAWKYQERLPELPKESE